MNALRNPFNGRIRFTVCHVCSDECEAPRQTPTIRNPLCYGLNNDNWGDDAPKLEKQLPYNGSMASEVRVATAARFPASIAPLQWHPLHCIVKSTVPAIKSKLYP